MPRKRNKTQKQPNTKERSTSSLGFVKEALTLIGGLAGSILAVYGLVKTFKDDAESFSWLIPVGIVIWLIILWRLLQTRKATAYSLFIVSLLVGVIGWVRWQSQVKTTKEKVIVLVAQFDGPEGKYHLKDEILKQLKTTTKNYGDTEIVSIEEVITEAQGSKYAIEMGQRKQADIVIWGWYTETEVSNVNMYIENISPAQFDLPRQNEAYTPEISLADLETITAQQQIGSELSNLIAFVNGYIRLEAADYEAAAERFEQILQNDDATFFIPREVALILDGVSFLYLGKNEIAAKLFEQAIELDPASEIAYSNLGIALSNLGKYDDALNNYNKAIQLNPEYAAPYINRGNIFAMRLNYDQALDDYNTAIQLEPNYWISYDNRGKVYVFSNKIDLALNDFNKAIELKPDSAYLYLDRDSTNWQLGKKDVAISDYSIAIKLDPEYALAYYARGNAYKKLGRTAEAEADFKKYEELTGEQPPSRPSP